MLEIGRHEDFSPITDDWHRLLRSSKSNTVFSTLAWKQTWWKSFGNGSRLSILSCHKPQNCVALLPLMAEGGTLSLIGGSDVSDYLDFIVKKGDEEEVYENFLRHIDTMDWQTVDLHCLPADSPTLRFLPDWAAARGYETAVSVEEVCPYIDLPATWEGYLEGLGKKDRHELRRKMRRLEGSGNVTYERVADTSDLAKGMADFFRLHRLSREEKAEFMDEKMEGFFTDVVARFLPEGRLRLYFMAVEGQRVSSVICFDEGPELWLYNSGYDPAYASLSVGLLLKAYCVQEAIAEGKKKFDFLRGKEPYKYHLGGKDVPIYRCLIQRG